MRRGSKTLLLAAVLALYGVAGCDSGSVEIRGETGTVGCGFSAEEDCPPSWTLSVRVLSASDGAPLPGAAVTVARLGRLSVTDTDAEGLVLIEDTGPFSPCGVICRGMELGTLDCLEEGQTDTLTTVTAQAAGYLQDVKSVPLSRNVREVVLELVLQQEAP